MELKPFDLEAAKNGAPVVTRGGRPVRIICFDRKSSYYQIISLVKCSDGTEDVYSHNLDGTYSNKESVFDLFMAPIKHTRYVNIYKNDKTERKFYKTEEEAKSNVNPFAEYIYTKEITWEE